MSARKQKAVVVTHFDKDYPENAVEVVEKPVPTPKPGAYLFRLLMIFLKVRLQCGSHALQ